MDRDQQAKQVEKELDSTFDVHLDKVVVYGIACALIMAVISNEPLGNKIVQSIMTFVVSGGAFLWGGASAFGFISNMTKLDSANMESDESLSDKDAASAGISLLVLVVLGLIVGGIVQLLFGNILGGWAFVMTVLGQIIGAWVFWTILTDAKHSRTTEKPKRRG